VRRRRGFEIQRRSLKSGSARRSASTSSHTSSLGYTTSKTAPQVVQIALPQVAVSQQSVGDSLGSEPSTRFPGCTRPTTLRSDWPPRRARPRPGRRRFASQLAMSAGLALIPTRRHRMSRQSRASYISYSPGVLRNPNLVWILEPDVAQEGHARQVRGRGCPHLPRM
jgi:hypothetical protein